MRKLFLVLISIGLISFYSCDDGEILDFNLEFEDDFSACEGVSDLVLYKSKNDPSESLSLLIKNYTIEDMIDVGDDNQLMETKSCTFNYRTYSNASISGLFCNDIPPSDIIITKDEESTGSAAEITTILTEDDNDGIPAEFEDINGNGDLEDDDTDNDGIPNYKDLDDDGDNVRTKDENPDPNGDGVFDDAQDSDNNGVPDYLDKDDDGDGVDTRDEENASQDNNPTNDETNSDVGPDYLNPDVDDNNFPATEYITHTISKTYLVSVTVKDISINQATIDTYFFGILNNSITSSSETLEPVFN